MSELVPLSRLITVLQSAIDDGKSGAFFITTENQRSAMITLSGGAITGCKFRTARGYDAASSLAKVAQLKFQTAAEPTELPGEADLDTRAVLEILGGASEQEVNAATTQRGVAQIDLDALRARYVAAIGPIAGALFDEAINDMGDDLATPDGVEKLIQGLAEQIDDEREAASFLQDARARL